MTAVVKKILPCPIFDLETYQFLALLIRLYRAGVARDFLRWTDNRALLVFGGLTVGEKL